MNTRDAVLLLVLSYPTLYAQNASDEKPWTIEGTVIDSVTNSPIAGAAVRGTYCPVRIDEVITDTAGHYKLRGDKPGACSIYPFKEGYVANYQMMRARHLTVGSGSHLTGIDIRLVPDAVIAGHVLDAEKNPVPGASVIVLRRAWADGKLLMEPVANVEVNDLGEYRITSVGSGTFYLQAGIRSLENGGPSPPPGKIPDHRPPPLARPVFYPNAQDLDGASPIRINPGNDLESMDFAIPRLSKTFCVSGNIAGSAGGPSSMIQVGLSRILALRYDAGIAGGRYSPGKDFNFCGVAPGLYHLTLLEPSGGKVLGYSQSSVVVSDRDVSLGTLSAAPSHTLRGKAFLVNAPADAVFPDGISIQVFPDGRGAFAEDLVAGNVPPSGDFSIPAAYEGDFRLSVNWLPAGYYLADATQDARDITRAHILVPGGDLRITIGSDGPGVTGQVVDRDNQPIPDAVVLLKNSAQDQVISRSTDQDGRFTIDSRIAPGDYLLLAFTGIRASEAEDPALFAANSSSTMKFTLAPKESKSISVTAVPWRE